MLVATMLSRLNYRTKSRWTDAQMYQYLTEAQEQLIHKLNPIFLSEITEKSSYKVMTGQEFDLSTLSPAVFSDDSVIAVSSETARLRTDGLLSVINIIAGGTNYLPGSLVFTGGGGTGPTATYTVAGGGVIDAIVVTGVGTDYTEVPRITPEALKSLTWGSDDVDSVASFGGENYIDVCRVGDFVYCVSTIQHIDIFKYVSGTLTYMSSKDTITAVSLATDGTNLFVGASGNNFYGFTTDPTTGALIAPSFTNNSVNGNGPIAYADGIIYRQGGGLISSFSFNPDPGVFDVTFIDQALEPVAAPVDIAVSGSTMCCVTRAVGGDYLHVYSIVAGVMSHIDSILVSTNTAQECATDGTYFFTTHGAAGVKAWSMTGAILALEDTYAPAGTFYGIECYGGHVFAANQEASHGILTLYFDPVTLTMYAADNGGFPATSTLSRALYADADGIYCARETNGLAVATAPTDQGTAVLEGEVEGYRPFYTATPLRSIKEFTEKTSLAATNENPRFYTFAGKLYALQPHENPAVLIYYIRQPLEITVAQDCELDASLHELVITQAEAIGWEMDEKPARAGMALKSVNAIIKRMNGKVL